MSIERFNFKAKPGEPGFKKVEKNKYGHTVLHSDDKRESSLDDKVVLTFDPETGSPRADLSIWDTQEMKDLALKLNMPLDSNNESSTEEETQSTQMITEKDMDDLLQNIKDEMPNDVKSAFAEEPQDSRVRKVVVSTNDDPDADLDFETKKCADDSCGTVLPLDAKFCSHCGKLQTVNSYCIECGRKYHDREKFCPDCGCARQ